MYVTRPLSLYRNDPSALSIEPPDGPYTGYLVITDEEAEAQDTYCCGACYNERVERLPFPQDKILSIGTEDAPAKKLWFLPVLDKTLSSNCYYVIEAKGNYKGQACTSSRVTDISSCCFRSLTNHTEPKPLNPRNINQQFKIHQHHGNTFLAKSLDPDGSPPNFLRRMGWEVITSSRKIHESPRLIRDALGLDASMRTKLPSFEFPMSNKTSPSTIVGRWYCPFVFIREEEMRIREQMRKTMLYKVTLEQCWEEIYCCENVNSGGNHVSVGTYVAREVDLVYGVRGTKDEKAGHGGFVWYRAGNERMRREVKVGLSGLVVEKMRRVQEEGGWVGGSGRRERSVKVERVEGLRSGSNWRRFKCYVLVESFVFRRLDGSLVLKCGFRHTHSVKCKWE